MSLEITGKLFKVMDVVEGQGKNGIWRKQDFVIETESQYPKKICFSAWGDKVDLLSRLNQGDKLTVSFDVESREYNGKWYTDCRIWKLDVGSNSGGNIPGSPPPIDFIPDLPEDQGYLPF